MVVKYKNKTDKNVEIRGLIIAPGDSRTSHVLIKDFDEAVESGELSLVIDDGYRQVEVEPVAADSSAEEAVLTGDDNAVVNDPDNPPEYPESDPPENPDPETPPVEAETGDDEANTETKDE